MNAFDEKEYIGLCDRLGAERRIHDIVIEYKSGGYFHNMKRSVQTDRRGEVVFCVIRPNGKIVAITCREYPTGIFRIPTGGIGYGEDILEAVHREVREELGLSVEISDFAGVLRVCFQYGGERVMFYSYLFVLRETGGRLLADATDNEVSEVREVDLEGLRETVERLGAITGRWSDWGRFRYESSRAILERLQSRQEIR